MNLALQAATILVAMESGKNFWRPKFWRKSGDGDHFIIKVAERRLFEKVSLILFMSHIFYITQKSMFSSELSLALQTLLVPFLVWFVVKKKTAVECLIEIRVVWLKVYKLSVTVLLDGCHSLNRRSVFMTIKELQKVQRKVCVRTLNQCCYN